MNLCYKHVVKMPRCEDKTLLPRCSCHRHRWFMLPAEPAGYARGLYAAMREADAVGGSMIVIEASPETPEWAAVNDPAGGPTPVQVGQTVTVYNVMVMEQFASQTLKRTFGRIYFGALEPPVSAPASPGDVPSAGRGGESVGGAPGSRRTRGRVRAAR